MRPPISVKKDDDIKTAIETMLAHNLHELPVTDDAGHVIGFVDQTSIARAYLLVRQGVKPPE